MPSNDFDRPRATRARVVPALLLVGAAALVAAPSYAAVSSEWSEGVSRDQSFSRVLVVGISPDFNTRCRFERALASRIKSPTTAAIVSCDVMPPGAPLTREGVVDTVAAQNADAVLATSLIARSWEAQQGGTEDTRGGAIYKPIDSYYGVYGTVVAVDFEAAAPLTTYEKDIHVTTKLFETRGATVVYTVDTKVRNIESVGEGLAEITTPIAKRLRRDKLVR